MRSFFDAWKSLFPGYQPERGENEQYQISRRNNGIKAQRIRIGLTQEQLAEAMCVPKSTISAYENDKVDIKKSVIDELSEILITSPNYLHGYKEERKRDPYAESAAAIISSIKDEKIKALLLTKIQAAKKMEM